MALNTYQAPTKYPPQYHGEDKGRSLEAKHKKFLKLNINIEELLNCLSVIPQRTQYKLIEAGVSQSVQWVSLGRNA